MEQCLRIAIWMCLLIAYLQAGPLNRTVRSTSGCIEMSDMGFRQDISSGVVNVTFEFPAEPGKCYAEAAKVYIQELGKIKDHPKKKVTQFASDANNTLTRHLGCLNDKQIDTDCNFNKTVGNMTKFVSALKEFVEKSKN